MPLKTDLNVIPVIQNPANRYGTGFYHRRYFQQFFSGFIYLKSEVPNQSMLILQNPTHIGVCVKSVITGTSWNVKTSEITSNFTVCSTAFTASNTTPSTAFLVLWEGNLPVTGWFPSQRAGSGKRDPYHDSIFYIHTASHLYGYRLLTFWCNILFTMSPSFQEQHISYRLHHESRWPHQMETLSALLALCEANLSVIGGFWSQRTSHAEFDVFFDVRLNKRLHKLLSCRWDWSDQSEILLKIGIQISLKTES